MSCEVYQECVAGPSSFYFNDFEGNSSQEVFQGGANADAVSLFGFEAGLGGCVCKDFDESRFSEGAVQVLVMVCKEGSILGRLVNH